MPKIEKTTTNGNPTQPKPRHLMFEERQKRGAKAIEDHWKMGTEEQQEAHAEYERTSFGEQMEVLAMDKQLAERIREFIKLVYKRSFPEIDAEIEKLEDTRCSLPPREVHDQIAAQIRVLGERMDLSQVCDQYEDGDDLVMDAALDAWRWANGELWERYDAFPPSSVWSCYQRTSIAA